MNVADGSLEEARYYLKLALDLGYVSTDALGEDVAEVGRLLVAYARSLRRPPSS